MKIKSVAWKNFMSYGNRWQTLEFDETNSLCLLVGKNGNGKSTLRYVIEFGLYGKVTGRVLKDLPNRLNRNLEVKIELEASNHTISIHRGLEPAIFKVQVSDLPNFGSMVNKNNVQDELESLYGIPNHIFNNTMSLSVNDFKSFIKMKAEDKRRIIDKVFGLSIINKMRESLKLELKDIKAQNNTLKAKINALTDELSRISKKLEQVTSEIQENNEQRKEEIREALLKYKRLYKKVLAKETEVNEILNERTLVVKELEKKMNKVARVIDSFTEKLELFDHDKCPTCGTELSGNFFDGLKEDYKSELKLNQETHQNFRDEKKQWMEDTLEVQQTLTMIKDKKAKYNLEIRRLDDEADVLNENIDNQVSSIEELKNGSEAKLETAKYEEMDAFRELAFYEIVDQMLSENGIKKLAMRTILPPVNAQLKQLTKSLGIIYNIKFDENFDSVITHNGEEISVVTLSTGETKKLDSAVLIAIIKLMKIKFPGLNLLFLDEVFSSLDLESQHNIITITKKMSEELGLHIFVVNHSQLDTNQFTKVYQVTKKNSFSDIETESNS